MESLHTPASANEEEPARRYRTMPSTPSFIPFEKNPLSERVPSPKHRTAVLSEQETVPLQLPLPVLSFMMRHGIECDPAIPLLEPSTPPPQAAEVPSRSLCLSALELLKGKTSYRPSHLLGHYLLHGCVLYWSTKPVSRTRKLPLSFKAATMVSCGENKLLTLTVDGTLTLFSRLHEVPQFDFVALKETGKTASRTDVVEHIVLGGSTCFVLTGDASVYCWGDNQYGQCMVEPLSPTVSSPIRFRTSSVPTRMIACGGSYVVLIFEDGVMATWGAAELLGTRLPAKQLQPSLAPQSPLCNRRMLYLKIKEKIVYVSTGPHHAACVATDGTVLTWGCGKSGKLGLGDENDRISPTKVDWSRAARKDQPLHAAKCSCGEAHTVVVTLEGSLLAWGDNTHGQLGVPHTAPGYHMCPTLMKLPASLPPPIDVVCGKKDTSILLADGDVVVCGDASSTGGERHLSDGRRGAGFGALRRVLCQFITLALSASTTCAAACIMPRSISFSVFGSPALRKAVAHSSQPSLVGADIVSASGGDDFLVLVLRRGDDKHGVPCAFSMGCGRCGQLGIDSFPSQQCKGEEIFISSFYPVHFPSELDRFVPSMVCCGPDYCIALSEDGMIMGWGSNEAGQLGHPPTLLSHASTPVPVPGYAALGAVSQVACGQTFVAVLMEASGSVYCHGTFPWNSKTNLQKSDAFNDPVKVPNLPEPIVSITAGSMHVVALGRDGKLFTWGCGVLGCGAASTVLQLPRRVFLPSDAAPIASIGCGPHTSFAITTEGELFVWGDNRYGQVGVPPGNALSDMRGSTIPQPMRVSAHVREVVMLSKSCVLVHQNGTIEYAGEMDGVPAAQGFKPLSFANGSSFSLQKGKEFEAVPISRGGTAEPHCVQCFPAHNFVSVLSETNRPTEESVCHAIASLRSYARRQDAEEHTNSK